MTLTPTDFHLALEAVVAYVDGELSPGAAARAAAHLNSCQQCSMDAAAQREAKLLLAAAAGPQLPGDLLSRLRQIPFTTDLQTPGMTLAMHGEELLWSRSSGDERVSGTKPGQPAAPPDRRPPARAEAGRPANRRKHLSATRMRRLRMGLVGAVTGLTVGVLAASVAPAAVTAGTATSQNRPSTSRPDTESASALLGTMDEVIGLRRFSGAATGPR